MDKLCPDLENLLNSLNDGVYMVDNDRCLISWNSGAERITGYSANEMIGTHCWDNILMHIDSEGQSLCLKDCPLLKAINTGKKNESRAYLQHKDGYRIPVLIRTMPITDEKGDIVGAYEIFKEDYNADSTARQIEELGKLALIDPLTGMPNRRYIEEIIESRISDYNRYKWKFGLLFIDIDHFKDVNDKYGHKCGDAILKTVTKTILHNLRKGDRAGRWGGDEIVIVLPNTDEQKLMEIASRFKILISKSSIEHGDKQVSVTISAGGTVIRPDDNIKTLLDRADKLMYRCKASGRDCIIIEN